MSFYGISLDQHPALLEFQGLNRVLAQSILRIKKGDINFLEALQVLNQNGLKIVINTKLHAPVFHENYLTAEPPTIIVPTKEYLEAEFYYSFESYLERWPAEKARRQAVYDEAERILTSDTNGNDLLLAHREFIKEGGDLRFETPVDRWTTAYFVIPGRYTNVGPIIVLPGPEAIANGTYKHELKHFRDWLHTKRRLSAQGFSSWQATSALFKLSNERAEFNARTKIWLESHAVEKNSEYPYTEAIRAYTDASHFEWSMEQPESRIKTAIYHLYRAVAEKTATQVLAKPWDRNSHEISRFIDSLPFLIYDVKNGTPKERSQSIDRMKSRYKNLIQKFEKNIFGFDIVFFEMIGRIKDPKKEKILREAYLVPRLAKHRHYLAIKALDRERSEIKIRLKELGLSEQDISEIVNESFTH